MVPQLLGSDAGPPPDLTSSAAEQLRWLADRLAPESDVTGVVAEIERRFDVYKAHLRLISGFVPPAVNVDTVVIGAQESEDNAADWARALPGDVRSVRVRGDHYSFLDSPGVQEVAAALRSMSPSNEVSLAAGG